VNFREVDCPWIVIVTGFKIHAGYGYGYGSGFGHPGQTRTRAVGLGLEWSLEPLIIDVPR